jgi:integrase
MSVTRKNHYQEGSLDRVSRAKGPDVWVYRWRETRRDGRRVQKKKVIGALDRYPTEASAKRAVEKLRIQINAEQELIGKVTVIEAWEHFQANELYDPNVDRSPTTIELYLTNFRVHIMPRWGETFLTDVKAVQVEAWLRSLPHAPATKCKLRNQLSALFSHAIRHELYDRLNPISAVRQSAKREKIPDILSLEEMAAIVSRLKDPGMRLMVLIAAVTALRKSEIRGLRWSDVDFDALWLRLARGKVRKMLTKLKTEQSRQGVPISQELAEALKDWRRQCLYRADHDWVFASAQTGGREPRWLDMVLRDYIRPAAQQEKIFKTIGWHTFRRSVSSALGDRGEPLKVVSQLLRHAKMATTFELYQQSSGNSRRAAQDHMKELFVA